MKKKNVINETVIYTIYSIQHTTTFPPLPDVGWPISASKESDGTVKLRTAGTERAKT